MKISFVAIVEEENVPTEFSVNKDQGTVTIVAKSNSVYEAIAEIPDEKLSHKLVDVYTRASILAIQEAMRKRFGVQEAA